MVALIEENGNGKPKKRKLTTKTAHSNVESTTQLKILF